MKGVSVHEAGGWSEAIREAIRRKSEAPGDGAEVVLISPTTEDREDDGKS